MIVGEVGKVREGGETDGREDFLRNCKTGFRIFSRILRQTGAPILSNFEIGPQVQATHSQ
jgi:hypothetical protein